MFIDTIEGMSDSKYSLMKNISGKCSGEKMHPKMKIFWEYPMKV